MPGKKLPEPTGPALTELKLHLRDNGVDADARQVATVLIAIARDKVNKKEDASGLLQWIQQLAIDLVQ